MQVSCSRKGWLQAFKQICVHADAPTPCSQLASRIKPQVAALTLERPCLGVEGLQGSHEAALPKARGWVLVGPKHIWIAEEQLHAALARWAAVHSASCKRVCSAEGEAKARPARNGSSSTRDQEVGQQL